MTELAIEGLGTEGVGTEASAGEGTTESQAGTRATAEKSGALEGDKQRAMGPARAAGGPARRSSPAAKNAPERAKASEETRRRASEHTRRSTSHRRKGPGGFKGLAGKEPGGILLAEYLAAVVLLCVAAITRGGRDGYTTVMANLTIRLTAVTGVFFVLFLLAGTRAGKTAAWFGLLVDVAIFINSAQRNVFLDIGRAVTGTPTAGTADSAGNVTVTADDEKTIAEALDVKEPTPDVVFPDGDVTVVSSNTGTSLV